MNLRLLKKKKKNRHADEPASIQKNCEARRVHLAVFGSVRASRIPTTAHMHLFAPLHGLREVCESCSSTHQLLPTLNSVYLLLELERPCRRELYRVCPRDRVRVRSGYHDPFVSNPSDLIYRNFQHFSWQ